MWVKNVIAKNLRVKNVSKNMMIKIVKEKNVTKKMRIKILRAHNMRVQNVSVKKVRVEMWVKYVTL